MVMRLGLRLRLMKRRLSEIGWRECRLVVEWERESD